MKDNIIAGENLYVVIEVNRQLPLWSVWSDTGLQMYYY